MVRCGKTCTDFVRFGHGSFGEKVIQIHDNIIHFLYSVTLISCIDFVSYGMLNQFKNNRPVHTSSPGRSKVRKIYRLTGLFCGNGGKKSLKCLRNSWLNS